MAFQRIFPRHLNNTSSRRNVFDEKPKLVNCSGSTEQSYRITMQI